MRNGSPHANIASGRKLMLAGRVAEGATRLRTGLDKLLSDRDAALWLYIARLRTGQAELANTELAAAFARREKGAWPGPVADFYLGRIDAPTLLRQAADTEDLAATRRCHALAAMAQWHDARGERAQSDALAAQGNPGCAKQDYFAGGSAPEGSPAQEG